MADSIITPNMNLPVPTVSVAPGPTYAELVDQCFVVVDGHTHGPGSGVQISPDGLNINAELPFNGNFAVEAAGVSFLAQGGIPANGTIYMSGNDLFYVDGLGNNVRITQTGAVAGTPGSIANLVPPASASYVALSSTFVWQSNTNIAANMDFGAAVMRNLSPNSTFALTLRPPAALSSNFTLTLPTIPGSTSFLTLDTSGNITGSVATSGGITASNIASGTQIPLLYQSVTGTDTVSVTSSIVLCDSSGGAYTLSLYTPSGNSGKLVRIKKTTNDFNVITISGTGLSTTINTIGEEIEVSSDGSNWILISRVVPGAWTSYTPSLGVGFGTPSNVSFFYRRVGSSLEVDGSLTTGTVAANLSSISLPSGLSLDTGAIGINNTSGNPGVMLGDYSCTGAAGASGRICTATSTSTTLVYHGGVFSSANPLTPGAGNGSVTMASGSVYSTKFTAPISGWNS